MKFVCDLCLPPPGRGAQEEGQAEPHSLQPAAPHHHRGGQQRQGCQMIQNRTICHVASRLVKSFQQNVGKSFFKKNMAHFFLPRIHNLSETVTQSQKEAQGGGESTFEQVRQQYMLQGFG